MIMNQTVPSIANMLATPKPLSPGGTCLPLIHVLSGLINGRLLLTPTKN